MECELYWQNGEVYAGATFKDQRVNKLAIFLGQTCNFSGRSVHAPLTHWRRAASPDAALSKLITSSPN